MISSNIEWILIVTGLITASMLFQFLAPAQVLRMSYGQVPADSLGLMFARHWGLLVFCIGVLLIIAAYQPAIRVPVIVVALVEKVALGGMILGSSLRQRPTAVMIAVTDLVVALIYGLYLLGQ